MRHHFLDLPKNGCVGLNGDAVWKHLCPHGLLEIAIECCVHNQLRKCQNDGILLCRPLCFALCCPK